VAICVSNVHENIMKVVSKKDLKNITVEVNKNGGFTVWVTKKEKVNGKIVAFRHWIIDGSCIKEDGEIKLGNTDAWRINAKFDKNENTIYVTKD